MRRFAQFFLIGCFFAISGFAQRGGGGGGFHGGVGGFHGGVGGFHGGGYVSPGFRGGGWGGYRGGYFPGNRFAFGFGFPGYWPYYGTGWGYPYYGYPYYYPYANYPYAVPYSYPNYAYVYTGPDQAYCPHANGKPLYLIKLTYDNRVWVSQEYWYTADTLNFITLRGEQNKTPINSIDFATTLRLNGECGLNFQ